MDFRDVLRRRRMVRHYTAAPVAREKLERICATVRRAPSGGFSQGQRLLVVTDGATRLALADALDYGSESVEPWLETAPAIIFVCAREQDYHDRYNRPDKLVEGHEVEWPVPFWFVDAGAAMMLLLLAAVDEGLAAGVFGVPVEQGPAVRALLDVPDEITIVVGVTVGEAAPDPEWSKRTSRATQPRRPLDELIRWERWDGA